MTKAEEFAASDKLWPDGPWFEYGYFDPVTRKGGPMVGRLRSLCLSDKIPLSPTAQAQVNELADDLMARLHQTIQKMDADNIKWLKL